MQITLGQYIDYQNEYGDLLDKELIGLIDTYKPDLNSVDYQIAIDNHLDKEALSWFSFWTRISLLDLMGEPIVKPLLDAWRTMRSLIVNNDEVIFPFKAVWKSESWEIQNWSVTPESQMSFNEIVTSKEIMRQIYAVGQGKWQSMPFLCAIFFRREAEVFEDSFVHASKERLMLMQQELPFAYALKVGFFLSICVAFWSNTFLYSRLQEVKKLSLN